MIIQKLLIIEHEARDEMFSLEKEQAYLAKKSEKEQASYIEKLEWEKDAEIQKLIHEIEATTAATIKKIQTDYEQKGNELVEAFKANGGAWADEVFRDVLRT